MIAFLLLVWGSGLVYLLRELRALPASDPLVQEFHTHLYRVGWGTLMALVLLTAELILAHHALQGRPAGYSPGAPWIHVAVALLAAYPAVNFALFLRRQGLRPHAADRKSVGEGKGENSTRG